ncbi:MAG: hypothetical protein GSR84_06180 [Desulfurococcales archaeon]|nr:hypothetical protein [Desulfurococcales archaeon]
MTGVRLRLAALANLASAIARIGFSLLFIITVARRLGVEGFAALGIILSLYQAIPLLSHIWHWWAQRTVGETTGPEAKKAAGTGLLLSIAAAPIAALIYSLVAWTTLQAAGLNPRVGLLAAPAVAMYVIARYMSSGIIGVTRPELLGPLLLVHEAAKLGAALVLVAWMGWGLRGAVASLDIASLALLASSTAVYSRLPVSGLGFSRDMAIGWLRRWRLPISILMVTASENLVRPVYTWVTGLIRPVAYLNMALSIAGPMTRMGHSMVPGLYASSLRGGGLWGLEETIRIYLAFLGLLLALIAGASRPIASFFNPVYIDGHLVLIAGAIYSFIAGLSFSYRVYIQGSTRLTGEGYRRLYRLVTWEIIVLLLGMVLGAAASTIAGSPWKAATLYMTVIALARLAAALRYHLILRRAGFRFPWRSLMEAILAGLGALAYLKASGAGGIIVVEPLEDGVLLGAHLAVSATVYGLLLLAVSPWARGLAARLVWVVARRVAS